MLARLVFSLFLISLTGLWGCGETSSSSRDVSRPPDGHERMLRLLEEIRARTPDEHEYLGDAALRVAQLDLSQRPSGRDVAQRLLLLARIGAHELRLGRNQKAVEHLLAAYELLETARPRISSFMADSVVMGLAVAYLRIGETQNCIECQTSESCILPISGKGVHLHQFGSRNAIKYFKILLARNPKHLPARWLLNVAYMTIGKYPDQVPKKHLIHPGAFESEEKFPRFVNVAADLGLDTFGLSGGIAVDDFDGDDFLDIVASDWDTSGQIRFFRNDGNGSFSDRTEQAGLIGLFGGLNLVHADYDNDGDVDVLVLRGAWMGKAGRHPNSLLQNDGHGRFRDVTFEAGLGNDHYPTQTAAWADYDDDGDLDLFVGNETFPCQLFENDGTGHFTDVAGRAGVQNGGLTKGVAWGDFDGDGFPDIYVSNLDRKNRLYRNNRNGQFVDVAANLGVDRPTRSFPVWFWDYNNDGALDLYVGSYEAGVFHVAADYLGLPHNDEPDSIYEGSGTGRFRNRTAKLSFTRVTLPMGCGFGDVDNDGFPDFYLGTGDPLYENLMPNLMFHNRGGTGFSDVTAASGLGHLQKGHGVAFADFDHDGDQDIYIVLGGAYRGDAFRNALFENPGFGNHWIKVKLIGTLSNRCAIGARIRLEFKEGSEVRSVYKWVGNGSSFGGNPLRQEIGLGQATSIDVLEVDWPGSGKTQVFRNVPADHFIEITEGESAYRTRSLKRFRFQKQKTQPQP